MAIAFSDEPRAIFLPKTRLVLTDTEISRKLGITEEVARASTKAAVPSLLASED